MKDKFHYQAFSSSLNKLIKRFGYEIDDTNGRNNKNGRMNVYVKYEKKGSRTKKCAASHRSLGYQKASHINNQFYSFELANCTNAGQSLSQSAKQRNTVLVSRCMNDLK